MTRDWSKLRWFVPQEFRHPGEMNWSLLTMLDALRERLGIPLVPTSDFRPGNAGAHGRGLAVDLRAHSNYVRLRIVKEALNMGFPRIGVYNRHIHLDIDDSLPPGMWGGVSR